MPRDEDYEVELAHPQRRSTHNPHVTHAGKDAHSV